MRSVSATVCLHAGGNIIYQGEREEAMPYFASLGKGGVVARLSWLQLLEGGLSLSLHLYTYLPTYLVYPSDAPLVC